jgi:predicted DNA-binding protein
MKTAAQISAEVSLTTKELLERYSKATGVKKGHLVEEALLHHIQALQELPLDIVVPARIVVSRATGERLIERLASPARPTKKLRELMSGNGD